MTCPFCQSPIRPGSQFCQVCGKALPAAACPNCQHPLRPQAHFCPKCGFVLAGAAGSPTLIVRWPGGQLEEHLLSHFPVHLGRNPGNDIVLNFPTVSGRHLLIDQTPAGLQISDLNSTNGSRLNGQLILPQQPHPLQMGDILRLGDSQGNSLSLSLKSNQAVNRAPFRTRRLAAHDLKQASKFIIGRDPGCQLHLDHPAVSRQHAEISNQQGHLTVRDLQSGNGTFVDGQRIAGSVRLGNGATIQIGPFKLVVDGQTIRPSQQQGHRLDAIDLGVEVSGGRMILQQIDLTVQPGEFVALVGGSGAGKSTLMKAMNGYHQATHGRMLIDGDDLYDHLEAYRPGMGYVPQDDIIHQELTVYRALWYAARLRLPDASGREIKQRIK